MMAPQGGNPWYPQQQQTPQSNDPFGAIPTQVGSLVTSKSVSHKRLTLYNNIIHDIVHVVLFLYCNGEGNYVCFSFITECLFVLEDLQNTDT